MDSLEDAFLLSVGVIIPAIVTVICGYHVYDMLFAKHDLVQLKSAQWMCTRRKEVVHYAYAGKVLVPTTDKQCTQYTRIF